jgi:hypothetical protein
MPSDSSWTYTGVFRLHFNRPQETPRLCSITAMDHSWEIICRGCLVSGVMMASAADLEAPEYSPKWWLVGQGKITLDQNGYAKIEPIDADPSTQAGS